MKKKRYSKRVLSLVLSVLMIVSIIPIGMVQASAYTAPAPVDDQTIQARINDLRKLKNEYFTVSHKNCGHSAGFHASINYVSSCCDVKKIIQQQWLKDKMSLVPNTGDQFPSYGYTGKEYYGGDSCVGFASYAEWYIYSQKPTDDPIGVHIATCAYNYNEMVKYAKPGDVIRTNNGHSAIVVAIQSDGLLVLDSNMKGGGLGNNECVVHEHVLSYTYCDKVGINRCSNYTPVSPQPKKPDKPSITDWKTDVAQNGVLSLIWSAQGNTGYKVFVDNREVSGDAKSPYPLNTSTIGQHSVYLIAYNKSATSKTEKSDVKSFTVHPPVIVTFINWDGTENEKQKVNYGEKPVAPSSVPEREGYTFNGWDGVDNAVYADTTINAKYTRNRYLVNFYKYVKNADGTRSAVKLGDTQKIWYGEDAVAPSADTFDLPSGHVFAGWSDKYENIKENKNIYLVDKWYNDNMSVLVSDLVAIRDDDGTGYTVTLKVTNNDTALTSGRVIVALKTSEEKLVETTESSAFSLKAGKSKELEIFIPSTKAASVVDAFAVEKFETAIPISVTQRANIQVNESNLWTDWSTEAPPADALNTQTKTQYKSRSKQYVSNGYSSLEGYNFGEQKFIDTTYSGWTPWAQGYTNTADANYSYERFQETYNAYYSYAYTTDKQNYYYFTPSDSGYTKLWRIWSTAPGGNAGNDGGHVFVNAGHTVTTGAYDGQLGSILCMTMAPRSNTNAQSLISSFTSGSSYPYSLPYQGGRSVVYRVGTHKYQYTHWKWGDWTEWNDVSANASDIASGNTEQEERTVYRYVPKDALGVEDNTGVQRHISNALSADYAGQQATLFVYKYDEASDWTNEYVGQCIIADDGTYNFDFILRDEPTVKTGDYRVTLGIEGTDMVLNLAPIKAPVEQFTVNYYNTDGTIISSQTVNKGDSAIIPDIIPEQEGYTFTGWSESNTAVKENLDILPVMKINTYSVVFIDWEHQTYELLTFNYGDALVGPDVPDTEDKAFTGWDIVNNGTTIVTENLVACAQFETKVFDVKFYDWEGNKIFSEEFEYGSSVEAPELDEMGVYMFDGWSTYDYYFVRDSLDIYPLFHFENTVEDPSADIDTGIYDETQTVTLSCATEDAEIYYTVDGSNPAENGVLYTAPMEIAKSTTLKFVAKKAENNNSNVITKCYAINKADMGSDWMTFAELPQEVVDNPSEYTMLSNIGYKYKDTMSTTSVALRDQLLADGWTLEDTGWTDYSEYSQTYPEYPDNEIEILSRDGDLVEKFFYNYSHYKYVDADTGETVCKPSAVEGTSGEIETIKLDNVLTVSKFVDGKAGYSYNGELWFNQEVTSEMVDPGFDVYSYRSKVFNLYKWTDWNVTAPSSSDTRERQSDTVFKYIVPNEYIVTLDYSKSELTGKQNEIMLVREGKTISIEDNYFDATGYTFDGLFTDENCTDEWDIENDTVSQSVTLYAKHTMQTFTVRFLNYDGAVISEQTVQYLNFAQVPEDPQRDGYVFVGWTVTAGSETGNEGITSDVDYTAQYVAEEDYVRVSLSRSRLSLATGSSAKINVILTSGSASDSEIYLYSSNSDIATVEQDGTITAVHSGTAVITALSLDTYESANCVVTVLGTPDTEILPVSNSGVFVDASAKYLLGLTENNNTIESIGGLLENTGLIYTSADGSAVYDESDSSTHLGTGFRIRLEDHGFLIDELEIVVCGDINGDGAFDAFDLFNTDKVLNSILSVGGVFEAAVDADGDGSLSLSDYFSLKATL